MDRPREWTTEERYLHDVVGTVDALMEASNAAIAAASRDGREFDPDDFSASARTVASVGRNRKQIEKLSEVADNPYFGRFDFHDAETGQAERIYVGPAHIGEVVYDWRAPICSLFYRTASGETSYLAPAGRIRGDLKLKRNLTVEKQSLVMMQDAFGGTAEDTGAGDALLLSLLGRGASTSMRQIVRSIQAEQDAVIRATGDVVVVHGPAGSGKTVVALHRAAYLLYNIRQQSRHHAADAIASAQSMVVFSPNGIFSDYIARVLPDLHEDEIPRIVLEERLCADVLSALNVSGGPRYQVDACVSESAFVSQAPLPASERGRGEGPRAFEVEPSGKESSAATPILVRDGRLAEGRSAMPFIGVESGSDSVGGTASECSADSEQRMQGAAYRSSLAILSDLEMFVAGLEEPIEDALQRAGAPGGDGLPDGGELVRRYRLRRGDAGLADRIGDVVRHIDDEATALQSAIRGSHQGRASLRAEAEAATRRSVVILQRMSRDLAGLRKDVAERRLMDLYNEFWAGGHARSAPVGVPAPVAGRQIAHEDVLPLACLDGLYRGMPRFQRVMHAIIDEAQEYSPLHFEYVKRRLAPACTLTIVGDLNQATSDSLGLSSYDELEQVFGPRMKRIELTRSYRSSVEIGELTSRILGEGVRVDNVRRTGDRPRLIRLIDPDDRACAIADLVKHWSAKHSLIAVIAKTQREAAELHALLSDYVAASLLTAQSEKLPEGVFVLPISLAKGLEFDAVIVPDASALSFGRPVDRRLLYVACTRALHKLGLFYSGGLSPFVAAGADACEKSTWSRSARMETARFPRAKVDDLMRLRTAIAALRTSFVMLRPDDSLDDRKFLNRTITRIDGLIGTGTAPRASRKLDDLATDDDWAFDLTGIGLAVDRVRATLRLRQDIKRDSDRTPDELAAALSTRLSVRRAGLEALLAECNPVASAPAVRVLVDRLNHALAEQDAMEAEIAETGGEGAVADVVSRFEGLIAADCELCYAVAMELAPVRAERELHDLQRREFEERRADVIRHIAAIRSEIDELRNHATEFAGDAAVGEHIAALGDPTRKLDAIAAIPVDGIDSDGLDALASKVRAWSQDYSSIVTALDARIQALEVERRRAAKEGKALLMRQVAQRGRLIDDVNRRLFGASGQAPEFAARRTAFERHRTEVRRISEALAGMSGENVEEHEAAFAAACRALSTETLVQLKLDMDEFLVRRRAEDLRIAHAEAAVLRERLTSNQIEPEPITLAEANEAVAEASRYVGGTLNERRRLTLEILLLRCKHQYALTLEVTESSLGASATIEDIGPSGKESCLGAQRKGRTITPSGKESSAAMPLLVPDGRLAAGRLATPFIGVESAGSERKEWAAILDAVNRLIGGTRK